MKYFFISSNLKETEWSISQFNIKVDFLFCSEKAGMLMPRALNEKNRNHISSPLHRRNYSMWPSEVLAREHPIKNKWDKK